MTFLKIGWEENNKHSYCKNEEKNFGSKYFLLVAKKSGRKVTGWRKRGILLVGTFSILTFWVSHIGLQLAIGKKRGRERERERGRRCHKVPFYGFQRCHLYVHFGAIKILFCCSIFHSRIYDKHIGRSYLLLLLLFLLSSRKNGEREMKQWGFMSSDAS